MINQKIQKLRVKIGLAATILIVAIILLLSLLSKSYIKITVDPNTAIVTINNKVVNLNSHGYVKAKVDPGETIIKVAADGYIGFSQRVNLKRGRTSSFDVKLRQNPSEVKIGDSNLANNNVQFISDADEDNAIFYLANNGSTLYKAKFSIGDQDAINTDYNIPISNPQLSGISKIIWSPQKDAAIFQKNGSVYTFLDFKKYNFVSQEEVKYGDNIGDLAWSPDNSKIAYYYAPPAGEKSLIFADKTNTQVTRVANLAEMGIENPYLSWSPDSEWLIVIPRNSDVSTNKIYLFNTYTRSFTTVNDSGGNLEAIFSPDNKKILYTTISSDPSSPVKSDVSIMDQNGDNKQSIGLKALLSKVIFLHNDTNKLIASTYNLTTKTESIFAYDIAAKAKSGFEINFSAKITAKELSLSNNDLILSYIANNKFYLLSLK